MAPMSLAIFDDPVWQMSWGERAAVEGVLAQGRPALAVEIGSMEGACLRRVAAYATEVHSFDLHPPVLPVADHVTLHTGNSHELLSPFLAELVEQERNVDFVIVDGDHSAKGVRQDVEDLLNSRALAQAVILIHDTANPEVRRGLDAIHFGAWPKVSHVELDWIPGRLFAEPALRNELWLGLGLVLVDSARLAYGNGTVYEQRYHPAARLLAQIQQLVRGREAGQTLEQALGERVMALEVELAEVSPRRDRAEAELISLQAELSSLQEKDDRAQRALHNITGSASWRMTEPLRHAKRRLKP